jgi:hypothetical protein
MSDSLNRRRTAGGFPILGICGLLLLAAGIVAIAETDAWACTNCNCYFSSDCATGQSCNWSSGCRVWYANGKKVDGTCTTATAQSGITPAEGFAAAKALDLWLQAYEQGALRGGEPDENLIAEARSLPLNAAQQDAIRQAAITTEITVFGRVGDDDESGRFIVPKVTAIICDPVPEEPVPVTSANASSAANGSFLRVDPEVVGVARVVREAMVDELLSPYRSDFTAVMGRIHEEFPKVATSGICQFPRLDDDPFPFKDGSDCLRQEALRIVRSLVIKDHERQRSKPSPQ